MKVNTAIGKKITNLPDYYARYKGRMKKFFNNMKI